MRHRNVPYMLAVYGAIAVAVVVVILLVNGVPAASAHPSLPTGLGVQQVTGRNVLLDPGFTTGQSLAADWLQEHSTASSPKYLRPGEYQEIVYAGTSGDVGLKRKIEVFQAIWKGVTPGQRWQFSIQIRGAISKSYAIVGMEWFSVIKHTVDGVTGYGYRYLDEQDVYPPVGTHWEQVTDISPTLPSQARCLAVYVQLPEITSATKIDIDIRAASLKEIPGSH